MRMVQMLDEYLPPTQLNMMLPREDGPTQRDGEFIADFAPSPLSSVVEKSRH